MSENRIAPAVEWFHSKGWKPYAFQMETWESFLEGKSGLLNAPTGSGKTYAMGLGVLAEALAENKGKRGLQILWITPIRALSNEIRDSMRTACTELGLDWEVSIRTGDTSAKERERQKRKLPEILITTPESLHLLMAMKNYASRFDSLRVVIADEWHELLGSKRAVQLELSLTRLRAINPKLRTWGISATIGNLNQALEVLMGSSEVPQTIIKADIQRKTEVVSVLPEEITELPWAGHLGTKMVNHILPIIEQSRSTLLFTNTRAQSEIWYRTLLEANPDLAGQIAMHHGSISKEIRLWVESELHHERLKVVVCTSSLDLGVDFRPVETVIQVGSPKGVGRFLQRAGRSNHRPGGVGRIYFVPTHALELIEAAAIKQAVNAGDVEDRAPFEMCFDVLVQYLMTLAVSDGFRPEEVFQEVVTSYSYRKLTQLQFDFLIQFLVAGGDSLQAYDDYHKLQLTEDGRYVVVNRRFAMRHRLSIGTIVSDSVIQIKYQKGGFVGTLEESFVSRLKPGDVFWFAGRSLEFISLKEMTALVKKSSKKNGMIHSWMGGRMPLSSKLSRLLREKLTDISQGKTKDPELQILSPLINKQLERSIVPTENQFLIERLESKEGHHLFFFPFEGRLVHEGLAALFAYRIAQLLPISFSTAYNDYGFELLSDQPIPIEDAIGTNLFGLEYLASDIIDSTNSMELAKRHFRDVAAISGLTFQGFPGKPQKTKHLQASSSLLFDVLKDHEKDHLLVEQTYNEVKSQQLEESRMRASLERIQNQEIIIRDIHLYTPLSFPIMVDRLRERLTSEKLSDRIKRMQLQYDK